jgi:hypothetical protein
MNTFLFFLGEIISWKVVLDGRQIKLLIACHGIEECQCQWKNIVAKNLHFQKIVILKNN